MALGDTSPARNSGMKRKSSSQEIIECESPVGATDAVVSVQLPALRLPSAQQTSVASPGPTATADASTRRLATKQSVLPAKSVDVELCAAEHPAQEELCKRETTIDAPKPQTGKDETPAMGNSSADPAAPEEVPVDARLMKAADAQLKDDEKLLVIM